MPCLYRGSWGLFWTHPCIPLLERPRVDFSCYGRSAICTESTSGRPLRISTHQFCTNWSQGSCIGPFKRNPFTQECYTSPLNTVDKHDSIDRRVIVGLSYPKWANSVNSAIDLGVIADADVTVKYPTIDALTELVVENGRGCVLFESDLKSASDNYLLILVIFMFWVTSGMTCYILRQRYPWYSL